MADGRAALRADGFHRLTPFLSLHFEAKRLALAMTIWMFYDLIITLPQNIGYIRPETWTLGRSLFVLNRFLVPILMLLNAVSLMIPEPSNAVSGHRSSSSAVDRDLVLLVCPVVNDIG